MRVLLISRWSVPFLLVGKLDVIWCLVVVENTVVDHIVHNRLVVLSFARV